MQNKNNRTPSFIVFWLKQSIIKVALIVVAAVVAIAVVHHYVGKLSESTEPAKIVKDEGIDLTPLQIGRIESIGEWEFLTINDEELIDTIRHGFFSDDELVRIYYGTLRLGINLKEAHEGWITVDGDTLRATLPPIRLLDNNFIDETRTRSFIETGKWTHADRKAMYDRAVASMRRRCLTKTNYAKARENAVAQFKQMLLSMGFEKTSVSFEE